MFFYTLLSLKWVFLGAIFGRIDGGGITKIPEWLERLLVMSAFVIACAPFAGAWSLAALIGTIGIATGHGQYFSSGTPKAVSPEKVDGVLTWLFGKDPRTSDEFKQWRDDNYINAPQPVKDKIHLIMQDYGRNRLYWRNVAGMFLTGQLVGLPAAILAVIFGFWPGLLFLTTGMIKAGSYSIRNTEVSEYLNGAGRHIVCLIVIFAVLGVL